MGAPPRKSSFVNRKSRALGGEIASRLAYTQKSEGQNLPGRPSEEVTSLSGALNASLVRRAR
jgi:hypothetical protein